ncbi:MAG: protein DA1 [Magnetococcales bacterium]|nr:protein DA1 [Magnetococcales bacterium]NGZ28223.1 protein DA1 [Magnetococcales bacterium]
MPICVACHQPIHGRFLQALGGNWHSQCFICPECRQPIGSGQFFEKKGYPFHPECYARKHAPLCHGCETPIVGTIITALGKSFHSQCFLCSACGKPIQAGGFLPHQDKPYHTACYHQKFSPRCVVCQGPIRTASYVTNLWGESHCEEHLHQYRSCFSCNRLMAPAVTGGGVVLSDGRALCQLCRQQGVENEFKGSKLLRQVRQFLHEQGMAFSEHPIPLRLTGLEEMQRLTQPKAGRPAVGVTRTQTFSRGGKVVERVLQEIVILHSLPEEHFTMVAAHELGHAWLFMNGIDELPPMVEEGLCGLCEHLWLKQFDTPHSVFRLKGLQEEKDAVYGQGYQAAISSLKRLSFNQLLDFIKKNRRFPISNPIARLLGVI